MDIYVIVAANDQPHRSLNKKEPVEEESPWSSNKKLHPKLEQALTEEIDIEQRVKKYKAAMLIFEGHQAKQTAEHLSISSHYISECFRLVCKRLNPDVYAEVKKQAPSGKPGIRALADRKSDFLGDKS